MWEVIDRGISSDGRVTGRVTERMKVPSGWLVRCENRGSDSYGVAMAFVPDPSHLWIIKKENKD